MIAASMLAIAGLSLFADRLPQPWRGLGSQVERSLLGPIGAIHSGKVGDYIAWLVLGVSVFGVSLALLGGMLSR